MNRTIVLKGAEKLLFNYLLSDEISVPSGPPHSLPAIYHTALEAGRNQSPTNSDFPDNQIRPCDFSSWT